MRLRSKDKTRQLNTGDNFIVNEINVVLDKIETKNENNGRLTAIKYVLFFEVWDNIRNEEIIELEGLFRHFYKHDFQANRLNVQRGFKKIRAVRNNDLCSWNEQVEPTD